jgi:hypothetical protein
LHGKSYESSPIDLRIALVIVRGQANTSPTSNKWKRPMPIYTVAEYRVRAAGVEKVKRAIEEFLPHAPDR